MGEFDGDRMWGWIEEITSHGVRRPGSPADLAAEAFLADRLRSFGYEDVRLEPIPVMVWHADETRFEVTGAGGASMSPEVEAIPYCVFTPEAGTEGPLVTVDAPKADWRGAIVVAEIGFPAINTELLLKIGMGSYDPDNTLAAVNHPATWVRVGWHHYREAEAAGAAGFIGILKDQPGGTCHMFGPYGFREADILEKPVPGAWVGRDDGKELLRLAKAGGARARLLIRGTREPGTTHNVVAELRGQGLDGEVTVLSCHHDSPFVSPVEDASGCSVVLALAEHFARERSLRRRLVVLFTAGHFYGSIGTRTFIHDHPDVVGRTALEVSIEHIALEAVEGPGGVGLVPTGLPEATAMFVSFSRAITDALLEGVAAHGLDRSILLPAEGPLGNYPPTDGGDWYEAKVPVINCISNPVYLLTDMDDFRWIDRLRLPRMAAAFDQILRRLDAEPRAALASAKGWERRRFAMKLISKLTHAWSTRLGTRRFY
jgi:hypothetical protein